jgi:hypothetical protein
MRHARIKTLINIGYLLYPRLPLGVFEMHNLIQRPVKMIGEIGYLLPQAFEGVAYAPPKSAKSTSCA